MPDVLGNGVGVLVESDFAAGSGVAVGLSTPLTTVICGIGVQVGMTTSIVGTGVGNTMSTSQGVGVEGGMSTIAGVAVGLSTLLSTMICGIGVLVTMTSSLVGTGVENTGVILKGFGVGLTTGMGRGTARLLESPVQ